jgi:hypothetical protein
VQDFSRENYDDFEELISLVHIQHFVDQSRSERHFFNTFGRVVNWRYKDQRNTGHEPTKIHQKVCSYCAVLLCDKMEQHIGEHHIHVQTKYRV